MTDINYRTLRGIDGYLAAFPNAPRGLEGRHPVSYTHLTLPTILLV